jgi:hypothetical protein
VTVGLVAQYLDLLSEEQRARLEVGYHRVIARRVARRVIDLSLERSLPLLEDRYVSSQHEDAPGDSAESSASAVN